MKESLPYLLFNLKNEGIHPAKIAADSLKIECSVNGKWYRIPILSESWSYLSEICPGEVLEFAVCQVYGTEISPGGRCLSGGNYRVRGTLFTGESVHEVCTEFVIEVPSVSVELLTEFPSKYNGDNYKLKDIRLEITNRNDFESVLSLAVSNHSEQTVELDPLFTVEYEMDGNWYTLQNPIASSWKEQNRIEIAPESEWRQEAYCYGYRWTSAPMRKGNYRLIVHFWKNGKQETLLWEFER